MRYRMRDCLGLRDRVVARGRDERRATLRQLTSVDPPPDKWALGNLPSDGASSRDGALVATYPRGYAARRGVGDELEVYAPPAVSQTAMTIADIAAKNRAYWEDAKPSTVADRALGAVAADGSLSMPTRLRAINARNQRHYSEPAS